jgi:hypothetical protein
MTVNRQGGMASHRLEPDKANRVEADHHAGAARLEHGIVVAAHRVESSVILNAYKTFLPVRWAYSPMTA